MQFECYVTMVSLPFLWYDSGAVCGHPRGVMIVQRYNCLSDWSVCMLAMFPVGALWDQRFDVAVVNTTKPKMINTWLTTLTKLPLSGLPWCCFVIDHTHSLIIYNPPDSCNRLDSSDWSSCKQRSRWQKLLPIDQTGSALKSLASSLRETFCLNYSSLRFSRGEQNCILLFAVRYCPDYTALLSHEVTNTNTSPLCLWGQAEDCPTKDTFSN